MPRPAVGSCARVGPIASYDEVIERDDEFLAPLPSRKLGKWFS